MVELDERLRSQELKLFTPAVVEVLAEKLMLAEDLVELAVAVAVAGSELALEAPLESMEQTALVVVVVVADILTFGPIAVALEDRVWLLFLGARD
jgi:hypothetical protein